MNDVELLKSALRANQALVFEAQGLLTRYLAKKVEAPTLIDSLLRLFDGPEQREAQRLAMEALAEPTFQTRVTN
jgi:hypothetical protein